MRNASTAMAAATTSLSSATTTTAVPAIASTTTTSTTTTTTTSNATATMSLAVWQVAALGAEKRSSSKLPRPLGMMEGIIEKGTERGSNSQNMKELKEKMAWQVATRPLQGILMNLFMLWMMGSSVNLFTFPMLGYMVYSPIIAISSISSEFAKLSKDQSFILPKIVYALGQLAVIGLAAWKCSGLGLIPTTQGDWLEFLPHVPHQVNIAPESRIYNETHHKKSTERGLTAWSE
eukprot:gene760-4050_t